LRLDKRLKERHPELSWRQIREAIEKGQVTVDGRVHQDPGLDVYGDAAIEIDRNRPAQSRARASFDILHEDDDVIVLNKPAGLLSIASSPEAASSEDTVLRRVRDYMQFKHGRKTYVGMLHRLDRDTSGSLAVALSKDAHAAGRELFKHHRFERHYLALVHGIPDPPQGTIRARISSGYRDGRRKLIDDDAEGLDAQTDYQVRERLKGAALLELRLHTGRQHQIRLHLEKLGHPLIGERVYTSSSPKPRATEAVRNMLHAWTLAFPHPLTGVRIAVEAAVPLDFIRMMKKLALILVLAACPFVVVGQTAPLRILVIEGEDAVNVVQQRSAVAPVVEVRDRNNLPVAGATVTFSIGGPGATFAGGAQTLTVVTNAAGQAAAAGLTPVAPGVLQINATALFQGQAVTAAITQTNVATAAAGVGSASTAATGSGASGGGISGQTIALIGGAAAAAGGVAVATTGSTAEPPALGISFTPVVTGIVDMTTFTFMSRNAANAAAVAWDFGDGETATGGEVNHVFKREGTFEVTAREGSASAKVTVSVGTIAGSWVNAFTAACVPLAGHTTCVRNDIITINVNGSSLSGGWRLELDNGNVTQTAMSGSINGRTLTMNQLGECMRLLTGTLSDDLRSFVGRFEYLNPNPLCLPRGVNTATWRRQ